MLLETKHLGWLTLNFTVQQKGWGEGVNLKWDYIAKLVSPVVSEGEVIESRGHTAFNGSFRLLEATRGTLQTWEVNEDSFGMAGFPNQWTDEVEYGTSGRYRLAFDGTATLYDVDVLTPEGKKITLPKVSIAGDLLVDDQVVYAQPDNHAGWFNTGRRDLFIPHQHPFPKDEELGVD